MTKEGWHDLVIQAVARANAGDQELLNLLSSLLEEVDIAKQALRDRGYGWTGLGLLETIQTQVGYCGDTHT